MVNKANNVINRAYKSFVPSTVELSVLKKTAEKALKAVVDAASDLSIDAHADFGGSYAKGTSVRGKSDIDIFVSFNSEKETALLKKLVPKNFIEQRGTRRYYRGRINNVSVEIVPVVKFSRIEDVSNSIDLSVLHAGYIKQRLNEKLRKDIIILKQFCKASGCYGSETFRHGFSGYSLELLIIHYGGILPLFSSVSSWKPNVFIDPGKHFSDTESAIKTMKINAAPIILVDPTNQKRNVCGSLNIENLARFVLEVKKFLLTPSIKFFEDKDEEKRVRIASKKRGTKLFEYSTNIMGPRDRFLSMYNKALLKLLDELSNNGIGVYDSTPVYYDRNVKLLIEVESMPITKTKRILGPEVWLSTKNFNMFLKEHADTYTYGSSAAYDKEYRINDFKGFIRAKLKEYIASEAILKS